MKKAEGQKTFYAENGTVLYLYDAMGQTEEIRFGPSGAVTTSNPLWLPVLEAHASAGAVSATPPRKEI